MLLEKYFLVFNAFPILPLLSLSIPSLSLSLSAPPCRSLPSLPFMLSFSPFYALFLSHFLLIFLCFPSILSMLLNSIFVQNLTKTPQFFLPLSPSHKLPGDFNPCNSLLAIRIDVNRMYQCTMLQNNREQDVDTQREQVHRFGPHTFVCSAIVEHTCIIDQQITTYQAQSNISVIGIKGTQVAFGSDAR